jgi:hypothetical protein
MICGVSFVRALSSQRASPKVAKDDPQSGLACGEIRDSPKGQLIDIR